MLLPHCCFPAAAARAMLSAAPPCSPVLFIIAARTLLFWFWFFSQPRITRTRRSRMGPAALRRLLLLTIQLIGLQTGSFTRRAASENAAGWFRTELPATVFQALTTKTAGCSPVPANLDWDVNAQITPAWHHLICALSLCLFHGPNRQYTPQTFPYTFGPYATFLPCEREDARPDGHNLQASRQRTSHTCRHYGMLIYHAPPPPPPCPN